MSLLRKQRWHVSDSAKVALLIETSRGYGRQLLRGIARYSRLHGPWDFYLVPGDFKQALPRMKRWGGAGIIARLETSQIAKDVLASGLPTIALDLKQEEREPDHPLSQLSEISSDSYSAAQLAAQHLLERRFQKFAFVGVRGRVWSDLREQSFCKHIEEAGYSVEVYRGPRSKREREWDREQHQLAEWLSNLPKPAGVMACNDDRGREVLEACYNAGIRVPEEFAVIGVDDDDLLCELADPPLTSVALDAEGTGFRAAALLDQMMKRKVRKPQRLLAKPLHVVTRRSTDIFAIEDSDVAAAIRFIHENATKPIQIDDVVRYVAISRRNIETRFRKVVGRTLHEELQRVRMDRAKRFLLETDLPIPQIADAIGFGTPSYFIQVFRAAHGVTPSRFRRQIRNETS